MSAAPRLIGYRLGEPMSTIYPPEYQQSPPQPPPLPPHRSWPRRHKILTALGSGFGLLVVLIIVIAATSAPSVTKPSTPATTAAAPATSAPAPTSYTAAQQKFIADMSAKYNLGDGTAASNANAVTFGNDVCSEFQSGMSESSIASAVQQAQTPVISASTPPASSAWPARTSARRRWPRLRPLLPPRKAAAAKSAAAAKAAAAKAAAAKAARIAAENTPISAAQWGRVIRNPDNYVGDIYTISGTVSEYNINSNTFASNANAALVATDANGNSFVVEADSSLLGNVQPGQTFTAKVTVEGVDQIQNTISGGTGEVPDFVASTFTVTG